MQRRFRVREYTWPVHWQGYLDYQRHQDRLERALREGDESSVCREVLTVREEGKTTRIAFQFLRQYGFEFDRGLGVSIGHFANDVSPLSENCWSQRPESSGELKPEPVIPGQVPGRVSGRAPGEVSEEGIRDFIPSPFFGSGTDSNAVSSVYKDWVLPGLALPEEKHMASGVAKAKTSGPLDIKRTMLANLVRNSRRGQGKISNINDQDLRYRFPISEPEAEKVPVVFLLRDVSSSMGEMEKSLSRWGFGLISAFLNNLKEVYPETLPVYIIHDVAAREVSQEEFFSVHCCGGTTCASAYRLMLETIQDKYSHGKYAVYGIHISDGNIRLKDGLECCRLVNELAGVTAGFVYLQVGEKKNNFPDSLAQNMFYWLEASSEGQVFPELIKPAFLVANISTREELISCLSRFFSDSPELVRSGANG